MSNSDELSGASMTDAPHQDDTEKKQFRKERRYTAIVLLGISVFTAVDLVEDHYDGAPWSHVLGELTIVIVAMALGVLLFRRSRMPLLQQNRRLKREFASAREDAKKWQRETAQLLEGLSSAITKQLDGWKLTEAEKDIALLLLKGLSHKEIAVMRDTTEQTVRQQATSLYQKSGLSGRTELSAFFLEDLLAPGELSARSAKN